MVSSKELETTLSNIEAACKQAIDRATGTVDNTIVEIQLEALKNWTAELSNAYVDEAKNNPKNKEEILVEGQKLAEKAWQCCEILYEFRLKSSEPQPTAKRWEQQESGVVPDELKAQVLTELSTLIKDFIKFRKEVLKA